MHVIGLTGGIASGKSTVSCRLHDLYGAEILDADAAAYRISEPDAPLWRLFVERYGKEKALLGDGTLNRAAIGEIVFANPEERKWLDSVSHPLVKEEILKQLEECKRKGVSTVVLDTPLLYEAGWETLADCVWVVYVSPETQMKRLMERNHLTEQLARDRIASQMPLSEKKARADVVIDNDGDIESTYAQIDAAWQKEPKG
ncbi:dephospho-CoA kinase [Schwartzia sp. (in: firmicutes)]